jgi:hypothetical protein
MADEGRRVIAVSPNEARIRSLPVLEKPRAGPAELSAAVGLQLDISLTAELADSAGVDSSGSVDASCRIPLYAAVHFLLSRS